jgi:hypothetical protein
MPIADALGFMDDKIDVLVKVLATEWRSPRA